ncbi:MAG: FtsX-like permease family protein, partial [Candidatus Acidiferrales bacterium]
MEWAKAAWPSPSSISTLLCRKTRKRSYPEIIQSPEPANTDSSERLVSTGPTYINLRSLDSQLAGNFSQERLVARLTVLFGLLALVLTSIGLYGITAYQTTQRTREIGLHLAFGADRAQVVGMVMRRTFGQLIFGLTLGIPISLMGGRMMESQLYLVKSYDPWSLAVAIFVLAAAVAVAGFVPARRAASIDPMRALR